MEKWLNSGWGNQHGILAPSMNPLLFSHQQQQQQPQSMFPQMVESAEQQGLLQAFMQQQARAELDSPPMHQLRVSGSLDTLLKSSNSSSMVDSVSDDECTAPENLQMNCISSLGGGGPMSPVLQSSLLDRTRSTGTSMMMNAKHFYHHHHRMESPVSPNSLPSRESDESLEAVATFKRRLEEDAEDEWLEQIHGVRAKLSKVGGHVEAAAAAFPQPVAFTNTTTVMPPSPPFLQEVNSSASLEMDKLASMREIVFRHASQPVPSLEEIASTRPKRRNVRISKDPQSVAARLRRERISDRIRVLQRLVPGGTKMDTASMLDEAIHYVKFLKLQLQTLEQIGNNSDPRGRPFDLNCTQGWSAPPAAVMTSLHHSQWRSDANSAFSDAVQEQFCH